MGQSGENKGVVWGIIFGLIALSFPVIFFMTMKPFVEEMLQKGLYDTFLDCFKNLQEYLLKFDEDGKIPAYGILPFAAYSFLLAIILPLMFPDDDEEMRTFVRIYLVFSIIMLLAYLAFGILLGGGNIMLFIANLVFVLVSLGAAIFKQQDIEISDEDSIKEVVIFIFKK